MRGDTRRAPKDSASANPALVARPASRWPRMRRMATRMRRRRNMSGPSAHAKGDGARGGVHAARCCGHGLAHAGNPPLLLRPSRRPRAPLAALSRAIIGGVTAICRAWDAVWTCKRRGGASRLRKRVLGGVCGTRGCWCACAGSRSVSALGGARQGETKWASEGAQQGHQRSARATLFGVRCAPSTGWSPEGCPSSQPNRFANCICLGGSPCEHDDGFQIILKETRDSMVLKLF